MGFNIIIARPNISGRSLETGKSQGRRAKWTALSSGGYSTLLETLIQIWSRSWSSVFNIFVRVVRLVFIDVGRQGCFFGENSALQRSVIVLVLHFFEPFLRYCSFPVVHGSLCLACKVATGFKAVQRLSTSDIIGRRPHIHIGFDVFYFFGLGDRPRHSFRSGSLEYTLILTWAHHVLLLPLVHVNRRFV